MIAVDEPFVAAVARRVAASVVHVVTRRGRAPSGSGAGTVWRPDLVVTCAHVVTGPSVRVIDERGAEVEGEVLYRDAARDLALLRIPASRLPSVEMVDPREIRPGAVVFAVGHPLGVHQALAVGVFQAVGSSPFAAALPQPQSRLRWAQADLKLAPGNSGGPLADAEGRVFGIATMVASGLAYAVPAPDVNAAIGRSLALHRADGKWGSDP